MSAMSSAHRPLRVAMVWNQTVQAEHVLEAPQAVVLGYGKDALFPLPEAQAARGDITLLTPIEGGYSLTLPPDARGALWIAGQRREVRDLVVSTPTLTVGPSDYGVVSLGSASYFFQQVAPAPAPKRAWLSLDGDSAASFGLSLFVHVCLLILMLLAQREFPRDESLELPPELVERFLVTRPPDEPPEPELKHKGDKLDEGGMRQKDEGGGKKQRDKEGKVGKRDDKAKAPEIAGESRGEIAAKVRGMGLLGALSGGNALRDALDVANVGSILSGLSSARTDLGGGSGGRGLRGVNAGGGGDAASGLLGGGGLGTGLGSGAGAGGGRGKGGAGGRGNGAGTGRAEAKVELQPGTPQVSGYLSAEQINRVVRANQAALRYCYETEVQRQRSLRGKVVVQWRVNTSGAVSTARVASSTLNSASVEGCILRQVKKWRFPKPDGGEVAVMYPFIFGVGG
jgi:TonB family protein